MLKHVFAVVLERCEEDMAFFEQRIDKTAITRLRTVVDSSSSAWTTVRPSTSSRTAAKKFEFPVEWGKDLQSEHERYLAETHVGRPVVVMNYPKEIKAFYMRLNDDGKTVAAMDVLAPGIGEIIGGSQREERLDVLDARMAEHGLSGELEWYRDLRRFGTVPHAGFGLGFERLLNYITGMENIRDAIPFQNSRKRALSEDTEPVLGSAHGEHPGNREVKKPELFSPAPNESGGHFGRVDFASEPQPFWGVL